MKHVFDAEIQALLRGEKLQFDLPDERTTGWIDYDIRKHDEANKALLLGVQGRFQFRIKPRTVKIGNREVEAPVLEPVAGQTLYWMHLEGVQKKRFHTCDPKDLWRAKHGRLFASHEAAEAMHAALTELLTGSAT